MILHSSDEILRRGMTRIMEERKLSGRDGLVVGLQAVIKQKKLYQMRLIKRKMERERLSLKFAVHRKLRGGS